MRAIAKYKLDDKKGACQDIKKSHWKADDPCKELEKNSNAKW